MPETPWRALRPADPSRTYLALLTYLPLKSFWRLPQFFGFTAQILRQLSTAPGGIGYAALARPLRREFWTLSVWEDEEELRAFVYDVPHVRVMAALAPHLGKTSFVRWDVSGAGVPPGWQDAFGRLSRGGLDGPRLRP